MTKKSKITPLLYSTQWLNGSGLPRDRATLNAWCRTVYACDLDVSHIIDCSALLPVVYNHLSLTDDPGVNKLFSEQLEMINMPGVLENMTREYNILGEVFVYAELNEEKCLWSNILIQNPDYVMVKKNIAGSENIFLRPDENMRRIILSKKEADIETAKQINSSIVEYIKNGENIPLDNFYASQIVRKMSPYEIRGTSPLIPLFSILSNCSSRSPEELDRIRQSLFDPTHIKSMGPIYGEMVYNHNCKYFVTLASWLNKKIIQPIAKMHTCKVFPVITFDTSAFRQDLGI